MMDTTPMNERSVQDVFNRYRAELDEQVRFHFAIWSDRTGDVDFFVTDHFSTSETKILFLPVLI